MSAPNKDLKAYEVLNLVTEGEVFTCPICGSEMMSIPEVIEDGQRAYGLFCPKSKDHYYIHAEDTDRVKEMRKRMDELLKLR